MGYDVKKILHIKDFTFEADKTGKYFIDVTKFKERVYKNPFHNLLELVSCYFKVYKTDDMIKLKQFAASDYADANEEMMSAMPMFEFISSMYLNSLAPGEDKEWMDFDYSIMDEILQDEFFDEYCNLVLNGNILYQREYPFLDIYCYAKLQTIACMKLPQEDTWDINTIWIYYDFIEQIYQLGWCKIIATVYKAYGVQWFINNGKNDTIMYKWACYAISACKTTGEININKLKSDLTDMYSELLISCTIRDKLDANNDIISYIKECINNFDDEHILELTSNIKNLKYENEQLIDENRQLTEGLQLLKKQVKDLQNDNDIDDDNKIEKIARRIFFLSPQNEKIDSRSENFKVIWSRLDPCTKKDIKLANSMFEKFESFDLALFPLVRSLEHEFDLNFFAPFRRSKEYDFANKYYCSERRYDRTHKALAGVNGTHPTMGNIPFIGQAIQDERAKKSSEVIAAFSCYLGIKKDTFSTFCGSLEKYRIGTQKLKLVDIRNGIAHGDDEITSKIDRKCYEQVRRMLYEPPVQLLFQIIQFSMKYD